MPHRTEPITGALCHPRSQIYIPVKYTQPGSIYHLTTVTANDNTSRKNTMPAELLATKMVPMLVLHHGMVDFCYPQLLLLAKFSQIIDLWH